ncbi:MAG: hypothetical protein ACEPOW_00200 [Bacteroidales bacterium]
MGNAYTVAMQSFFDEISAEKIDLRKLTSSMTYEEKQQYWSEKMVSVGVNNVLPNLSSNWTPNDYFLFETSVNNTLVNQDVLNIDNHLDIYGLSIKPEVRNYLEKMLLIIEPCNDVEVTISKLEQLRQQAYEDLSTVDYMKIVSGIEVAKESYSYWYYHLDEFHELTNYVLNLNDNTKATRARGLKYTVAADAVAAGVAVTVTALAVAASGGVAAIAVGGLAKAGLLGAIGGSLANALKFW